MARVYRHSCGNGRILRKWYLEYRDHAGRLRRVPGSVDKRAAQIMLGEIVKREERIRCGAVSPQEPGRLRLADAEEEFEAHLNAKGNTPRHIASTVRYLRIVADALGWDFVNDLSGEKAKRYLSGRMGKRFGADTWNHYRAALMSFGNWLVKDRRMLPFNPFVGIARRNPLEDPIHPRRTLDAKDFAAFLAAARDGKPFRGIPGRDREMLYLVAACSGLRVGALSGLTPQQFDLGSVPPVLYATASLQKNRKAHAIPLPGFLAKRLRPWLARRVGLLWPGPWSKWDSSDMVYGDLAAAGLEPETMEGWFDFHSLRHQYATMLVDSGASPAEVQTLLDHSSPTLTARYFKHLTTERLAIPVERLPKMG